MSIRLPAAWGGALVLLAAACTPGESNAPPPPDTAAAARSSSLPSALPPDTVENTPERVWLEAQARGLAFRASGSEPGWLVEVHPRAGLKALLDYGADSLAAPAPLVEQQGDSLVYTAADRGRRIRLAAHATPCEDAMSGARHTHTVRMTVDADAFVGCGRVYGSD